jgi:hypothetical protein
MKHSSIVALTSRYAILCVCLAAYELAAYEIHTSAGPVVRVEVFKPLQPTEQSPEHKDGLGNSLGMWRFVRPFWMVATIETGPVWPGLPIPDDWPQPESTSVVAVDAKTGLAKRLRLTTPDQIIKSLLPLNEDVCAIVVQKRNSKSHSGLQLFSWHMKTDQISTLRPWADIDPIARHLDLDKVTVQWPQNQDLNPVSSQITIGGNAFKSLSSVPLPFNDYSLPLEMTAIWEEGKETRWYAPADGVGVVFFRGVREGKSDVRTRYSPQSSLTLFDPSTTEGVRWQYTLPDVCTNASMHGLLPIYSHWQWSDSLLLQCAYTGHRTEPLTVTLAKMRLQDGVIRNTVNFDADVGVPLDLQWPHCTVDQKRISYLVEHPKYSPKIAVFDFINSRFLDELPCPSNLVRRLVTVLKTDEAVVTDGQRLWAIGIGAENYGASREILRLFLEAGTSP